MPLLVTGGAGFIGSHLIDRLLNEGHEVVCLDDFNPFYNPDFKRENVAPYIENPKFTLIEGDLRDESGLKKLFQKHTFQQVIHLAARAGVRPSLKDPKLYVDVNVQGTLNLLECMRQFNVPKMIFASSSSVYGVNSRLPFHEEDPLLTPISPYAATKIAGEVLCRTYFQLYGITNVCLRFFTVYGPKQRPEMAIYKFTKALFEEERLTLFGEGDSQRDYTFVADIVEGVCGAMKLDKGFSVYNLGDSQPVSLKVLLSKLELATGKKANVQILEKQPGDVPATYANIEKAKKDLGYSAKVSLDDGLKIFVKWYQDHRLNVKA